MRVPSTRVYRAFAELDRFTDEQCRRFVRAACRPGWLRHIHLALEAVAFVVLSGISFGIGALVLAWAGNRWDPLWPSASSLSILWSLLLMACVAMPPMAVLLVRDSLLRRRIHRVLRTRGVCPNCRYSLAGLPVSDANFVTCPECGSQYEVDPSLHELTTAHDGSGRFVPFVFDVPRRFWTLRRKRIARRACIGLAILAFAVLPAPWGCYELFLWRQALAARSARLTEDELTAYIESHQPVGVGPGDPSAWDVLNLAMALKADVDARLEPSFPDIGGYRAYADFSLVYDDWRSGVNPNKFEFYEASERSARISLDAYQSDGLFTVLNEITSTPRTVRWIEVGQIRPVCDAFPPQLDHLMQLERVCIARVHQAREQGDLNGFANAFEVSLALSRMWDHEPRAIDGVRARGIESRVFSQVGRLLNRQPPAEWLDRISSAMSLQRTQLPREYHAEGDRLIALDTIAWVFQDVRNVRFGRRSAAVRSLIWDPDTPGRLSTYSKNHDALNAFYDEFSSYVSHEPWERQDSAPVAREDLLFVGGLTPNVYWCTAYSDIADANRRGLQILIALERFRVVTGRYPEELVELTPEFLNELPLDPWKGSALGYRLLDPMASTQGSGFVLYSVGPDGQDNCGAKDPKQRSTIVGPLQLPEDGFDFIINAEH